MSVRSHHVNQSCHSRPQRYGKLVGFLLVLLFAIIAHDNHVLAAKNMCKFAAYKDEKVPKEEKEKLQPLVGKTFRADGNLTYIFHIGICTPPDPDKPDAAVIQQSINQNGKTDGSEPYVVGSLTNTHIMAGTTWLMLEYKDGGSYHHSCNGESKNTVIMIICDETADENNPEMIYIKEENSKTENCHYLFEMNHKAVCPVISSDSGLSVGSILVIVFVTVVGVYLVLGFLYSRFALGAKGIEQIPNYEFWKDFGNLQADGCDLVCRTKERRRSAGFGGIGDDMLDPAEEVRDDNLLPM